MRRLAYSFAALLVAVALVGCGGDSSARMDSRGLWSTDNPTRAEEGLEAYHAAKQAYRMARPACRAGRALACETLLTAARREYAEYRRLLGD